MFEETFLNTPLHRYIQKIDTQKIDDMLKFNIQNIIYHYGIVLTLRGHLYIVLAKMKVCGQNCPVQLVPGT